MGSFAAPLDLPERLRPFAQAGLDLLFAPGGLPELKAAERPAQTAAQAIATVPQTAGTSGDRSDHASPQIMVPAPPAPQSVGKTSEQAEPPRIAAERWPEPWRGLAMRVRTAPRVIITYASLADDMSGHADPARRKLLQSMLTYFSWPHGTTLFWPITFPTGVDSGGMFAADIFAAGVRAFLVRYIVCLGERPARRALTLFPKEEASHSSVSVLSAPEPEQLVTLLPHELQKVLAHIKGIKLF